MSEKAKFAAAEERQDDCRELVHVHLYQTIAQVADGHNHQILGISSPARLTNGTHIHRIKGRTSFVDGHWHAYDVWSGPAVAMPDGTHIHYYGGVTSEVRNHVHAYNGATNIAPDMLTVNGKIVYPREDE